MTAENIAAPTLSALVERTSHCRCGQPIFFRNTVCLACGAALGYEPESARLLALEPASDALSDENLWQQARNLDAVIDAEPPGIDDGAAAPPRWRRCAHLETPAACNWLVPAGPADVGETTFCRACRLNRTIPALNDPAHRDNGELWGKVERSKRRLVSALIALKLPIASRVSEDPQRGLMFDLLRGSRRDGHVLTGHEDGLITLNIEEADDVMRETARSEMGEPYRTLLGHFRHEVGHYYWYRLIEYSPWLFSFRELFGDERIDYQGALQQHYRSGARTDWSDEFVSAYASVHPWEDWAECWAHYLHMRDTVDTALNFGLDVEKPELESSAFGTGALYRPDDADAERFLKFVNGWTRLTTLLNEMSRSMGQPDFYPFVLTRKVVAKLQFIHLVVCEASAAADASGQQQTSAAEMTAVSPG